MTTDKHYEIETRLVNTSEAYSKNMYLGENCLVVPYINLFLMPESTLQFFENYIEYTYLCFHNTTSLILYGKETIDITTIRTSNNIKDYKEEWISLSGENSSTGAEVKIVFHNMTIYIPNNSRISKSNFEFVPYDTPKYDRTLEIAKVASFFSHRFFPDGLIKSIGNTFHQITIS